MRWEICSLLRGKDSRASRLKSLFLNPPPPPLHTHTDLVKYELLWREKYWLYRISFVHMPRQLSFAEWSHIWSIEWELQQKESSKDFNYELINPLWNKFQMIDVKLVVGWQTTKPVLLSASDGGRASEKRLCHQRSWSLLTTFYNHDNSLVWETWTWHGNKISKDFNNKRRVKWRLNNYKHIIFLTHGPQ